MKFEARISYYAYRAGHRLGHRLEQILPRVSEGFHLALLYTAWTLARLLAHILYFRCCYRCLSRTNPVEARFMLTFVPSPSAIPLCERCASEYSLLAKVEKLKGGLESEVSR